jgi:hypothetical protein
VIIAFPFKVEIFILDTYPSATAYTFKPSFVFKSKPKWFGLSSQKHKLHRYIKRNQNNPVDTEFERL